MAKRIEIYKCEACGNIVEVLHGGDWEGDGGQLLKKLAESLDFKT